MIYINDNIEIEYLKFGKGNKNLIIIPGLSVLPISIYKKQIENNYKIFYDDFTVYVIDRNKKSKDDCKIYDMAKDISMLIKSLNLDNIYIFGASQGGMIAMVLYNIIPSLIKKIIVGSSEIFVDKNETIFFENLINLAKSKKIYDLYKLFYDKLLPDNLNINLDTIINNEIKMVNDDNIKLFIINAKSLCNLDITNYAKNIKCDILAIINKDDKIFKSKYISKLDNFKYYYLDNYGHGSYDLYENYKKIMLDFYNK